MEEGMELGPMGEGKYEADDIEDNDATATTSFYNPAFDERGYIEDDYIGEPHPEPSWAHGTEMPEFLDEENTAYEYLDQIVARFLEERSQYPRTIYLKFAASASGDLWVRWGKKWERLTWKGNPDKFLSASSIEKYYGLNLEPSLGSDG